MADKAKAKSGWRKAAMWTVMGCLAIPVAMFIFAAFSLVVGYTFYNHDDPMRAERSVVTVRIGEGSDGAAAESVGIVPGRDFEQLQAAQQRLALPVRLNISLEEGDFQIRPGPPGSDIRVEGNFDPRDYELSQEVEEGDDEYEHEVTIRFRRMVPFLFMLIRGGFDDGDEMNEITVYLPEDLPMALNLTLSKGESDTELGGLTLTALRAVLRMGDHELAVSSPIRGELQRADFRTSMGEITLRGLGNLRAHEIFIRGKMGEMRADLGGDWPAGFETRADLRFSMGEFRLSIPEEVRISPNSTSSMFLGESHSEALLEEGPSDPDAPMIEIHASAKMGELRISRR